MDFGEILFFVMSSPLCGVDFFVGVVDRLGEMLLQGWLRLDRDVYGVGMNINYVNQYKICIMGKYFHHRCRYNKNYV